MHGLIPCETSSRRERRSVASRWGIVEDVARQGGRNADSISMRVVERPTRGGSSFERRERVRRLLFEEGDGPPSKRRIGGRYRLDERLAKGGMGTVYAAFDEALSRPVALKRLALRGAVFEFGFRREFHTLVSLRHPNVVEAFEYGIDDEGPFYTMELLQGGDLRGFGGCSVAQACRLIHDVSAALASIHARGLVHRDVSLSNIRTTGGGGEAKLIDFGLLSTAGVEAPVAGTPPFVAPETLRGRPLDHRVDLFALGGIAYYLLTGEHAFAAKDLADARQRHRFFPQAPARCRPEIPAALDALVLALLSLDPLARPKSAAEVIDRLGPFLSGSRPQTHVVKGYVASPGLVGRSREMERVRELCDMAHAGQGRTLVVQAPSGAGKSRLLKEITIEAQLRGAVALVVEADDGHAPYGVVRKLIAQLLVAAPFGVQETLRPQIARLRQFLPEAFEASPLVPSPALALSGDVTEDLLRVQDAIGELLIESARTATVVAVVDDLHRSDEGSLAVLCRLALRPPDGHMLLVLSRTTDQATMSEATLDDLQRRVETMNLSSLDRGDVRALVTALFGEIPNIGKLSDVIYEAGAGSPLLCTELVHHFVDHGIVQYLDGLWVVPDDIAIREMPRRLDEAAAASLACLGSSAIAVGRAMSVAGPELSLELTVLLSAPLEEKEVFRALDELTSRGILVGDRDTLRFRHRGLQDSFLRDLRIDERRALHGRLADVLLARLAHEPNLDRDIGYHLFRAGRRREAAPLLHRAGLRLYEGQLLREAIAVLEAAYDAYADDPSAERVRSDLQQRLVVSGAMVDRQIGVRHGMDAFSNAWKQAGLDVGETVARYAGRPLGFLAAVLTGYRRVLSSGAVHSPSPFDALRNAIVIGGASAAVYAHLYAIDRMEEILSHLRIFDTPYGGVPAASYGLAKAMYELVSGNRASTTRHCNVALEGVQRDRWTPLSGYDRLAAEAAIRNTRAWVALIDHDPAYETDICALEEMNLRSFAFSCAIFRAIFHRHRGEEPVAQQMEARAEQIRMQSGPLWMWEGVHWQQSSRAYALTRDVMGLKRCIEAMARMETSGYRLGDFVALARANYARESGDAAAARRDLLALLERLPFRSVLPQDVLISIADTAMVLGDLTEAKSFALRAEELAADEDKGMRSMRLRASGILAYVDAMKGSVDRACARIDSALVDAEALGSPVLVGGLHESGAAIAAALGLGDQLDRHVRGAAKWFRQTGNPALVARFERVKSLAGGRSTAS